jgi:hypothetical protein
VLSRIDHRWLKAGVAITEIIRMDLNTLALLTLAGMGLTLYIMRRRVRLGRRTGKF